MWPRILEATLTLSVACDQHPGVDILPRGPLVSHEGWHFPRFLYMHLRDTEAGI